MELAAVASAVATAATAAATAAAAGFKMIYIKPKAVFDLKFAGMASSVTAFVAVSAASIITAAATAISTVSRSIITHYMSTTFQLKCRE